MCIVLANPLNFDNIILQVFLRLLMKQCYNPITDVAFFRVSEMLLMKYKTRFLVHFLYCLEPLKICLTDLLIKKQVRINKFIGSISNCIAVTKQCGKTILLLMYLDKYFTSKQCNNDASFRRPKMNNKFVLEKFLKQNRYRFLLCFHYQVLLIRVSY